MKLTTILMVLSLTHLFAAGYAQKVSINVKNAQLSAVLKDIQKQTGYSFLYNTKMIRESKPVAVSLTEIALETALQKIFEDQPLTFLINRNTVIVKKRPVYFSAFAEIIVTGKVTDETGLPLPGVTVKLKGSGTGMVTTTEGAYSLNVPEEGTLVFSYLGYIPQEIKIAGRKVVDVTLKVAPQQLEQVVVVGYGTQRRSSITGSIDQVSAAAIEGKAAVNMSQALQGVAANLTIQQRNSEPGAGLNINIRGISTLGNNSPLVVIDGIIGGDINLLNPSDIESVTVLKDAGSAAIYGSRANNGVLLITTKKGKKNTRTAVTYNGLAGVNTPKMFFEPVKGFENAILRNQSAVNANQTPVYNAEQIRQFQEQGDNEWFVNSIIRNAMQQNHNLSISGGSDKSTFLSSIGYTDQRNSLVGPDYGLRRYNYRINLTNEYGKLKLTTILAYTRSEIKDHSSSTSTLMVDAARVPLYYKLKDEQGRYLTNDVLNEFNPLGILEQGGFRKYNNDNVFGNLNAEFAVTDFLKLKAVFGGSITANNQFARSLRVDYFPKGSSGQDLNTNDDNSKNVQLNTQFIADFNKTFNKDHDVNVLVGVSAESSTSRRTSILRKFTDPELGTPVSGTIIDPDSRNSNRDAGSNSLNSLFGRASYAYKSKYYGEFTFRFDGSSKFNKTNRWGFFPSIAGGYRISQESFMDNYREKIGDLKVRASYGVLGNQSVNDFQYQTTYFTFQNAYSFNNAVVGGTGFNFANPDIRWESAATYNVGADLSFLKNKLAVSLDYYTKITRDILIPPQVPGVFGTALPDFNAGEVRNRGWEITTSYRHTGKVLNHTISLNLSDSQNEVLKYNRQEEKKGIEELRILLKEGFPYRSYIGFKRDGYFQNIDEVNSGAKFSGLNVQPGDNRYRDVNGDGVIDDNDLYVFGNPFPRYTFGLTYNVTFKGFDLNAFFQGVGLRTMMLRGELIEPFHFNYGMTMYQHQLDFWTPQNPDARYPRLAANGSQSNTNNYRRGSDMYLYDASYVRLKNLQLGYSIPDGIVKKLKMQKIRAYLSGQNLFTISGVKFVDPELSEFDNSMKDNGANSGRAYPTMVYYGFGLDITF